MKISIIVPCYNEEQVLPSFYEETTKTIQNMECECEFIFIDDGSADSTMEVIKSMATQNVRVRYVSFSRNFGKESAMYAGLQHAKGDYAVIMDADLQDPPSLLPEMLHAVTEEGYDSVATRRVSREGEPPIRSFFAKMFYKLINWISDTEVVDGARDYRMMSRKFVDALLSMSEYNRFSKGLFGWVGFKTKWIAYENRERAAGETKWSFWRLFKYSIDGIVDFSTTPLVVSSFVGVFFCIVAFIFLVIIVIRRLAFGDPVSGWASMISVVLFIGGILLFCVGILGQYLSKTYLETKKRPIYIARETSEDNIEIETEQESSKL